MHEFIVWRSGSCYMLKSKRQFSYTNSYKIHPRKACERLAIEATQIGFSTTIIISSERFSHAILTNL